MDQLIDVSVIDVSIVVASYNRRAGLERLLQSLGEQTYPQHQFEVIVVDDGSSDGTAELLATIETSYALRALAQENGGPATARNRGVQQAQGQIILFLDDDVAPARDLIERHRAAHADSTDRVVTGPMLPPPLDWPQPAWDRWDAAQLQKQYQAMRDGLFACSQRQFFTANASVHRRLFLDAGGFDPLFRRAEDMELAWRMSRHGAQFVFEPDADVVHYAARPFASWRRNAHQYGRYDVVMEREKAIPVFTLACREFHRRRAVNRWLTRLCVGHHRLTQVTVLALAGVVHVATQLKAARAASFALSSIFNVQYWQGVSDELGGPMRLWQAIRAGGDLALAQERARERTEPAGASEPVAEAQWADLSAASATAEPGRRPALDLMGR